MNHSYLLLTLSLLGCTSESPISPEPAEVSHTAQGFTSFPTIEAPRYISASGTVVLAPLVGNPNSSGAYAYSFLVDANTMVLLQRQGSFENAGHLTYTVESGQPGLPGDIGIYSSNILDRGFIDWHIIEPAAPQF
jgi:hypothetical protein